MRVDIDFGRGGRRQWGVCRNVFPRAKCDTKAPREGIEVGAVVELTDFPVQHNTETVRECTEVGKFGNVVFYPANGRESLQRAWRIMECVW